MSPTATPTPAVQGCIEVCRRCRDVAAAVPPTWFDGAVNGETTIGAHLRHCLDHFTCLLNGLEHGLIDYDSRERDGALERDPGQYSTALEQVSQRLRRLPESSLQNSIQVRQMAAPGTTVLTESTIERELVFLSGHTIHHLAVIEQLLKTAGVVLPEDISLAFSTAAYRAATN